MNQPLPSDEEKAALLKAALNEALFDYQTMVGILQQSLDAKWYLRSALDQDIQNIVALLININKRLEPSIDRLATILMDHENE